MNLNTRLPFFIRDKGILNLRCSRTGSQILARVTVFLGVGDFKSPVLWCWQLGYNLGIVVLVLKKIQWLAMWAMLHAPMQKNASRSY
jgi:hypothetical protein